MSGKRLRNRRQGDLAEGMGLELLRRFALVAPVPRSEDVGVDAVCNLLRRDEGVVRAENTFAVQIKAASVRSLDLDDEDDFRFLFDFDLPLFWLSIDLRNARASLHSMINLAPTWPTSKVKLLLDLPVDADRYELQPWIVAAPPKDAVVWLGAPVVEFEFPQAESPEFCAKAYEILKAHVVVMEHVLRAPEFPPRWS